MSDGSDDRSDVSPDDPEPFFAGVKGVWSGSGLDLSSLDIYHVPPVIT